MTPLNKTVFNAYVKYMRKTARAYNRSNKWSLGSRRCKHWMHEYFRYAKIATRLAWQMPVEHRINFIRFVAYDQTRNMLAFTGTVQQAKDLCK
jgi:hypothetical protein